MNDYILADSVKVDLGTAVMPEGFLKHMFALEYPGVEVTGRNAETIMVEALQGAGRNTSGAVRRAAESFELPGGGRLHFRMLRAYMKEIVSSEKLVAVLCRDYEYDLNSLLEGERESLSAALACALPANPPEYLDAFDDEPLADAEWL
jgi:hypothetical protein